MRCRFCFATFQDVKHSILPKGHLPKEQAFDIIRKLADYGFKKITFAGGEPTLCPWLSELIKMAKEMGMTTMIVTNASQLTDAFLEKNQCYLDWIAISIDSLKEETNLRIGRAISGKKPFTVDFYKLMVDKVKKYGYGLKINTVVNRQNYKETMTSFIHYANPKRWKVLQVLPIIGQNDTKIDDLTISEKEFQLFLDNHSTVVNKINIIPETNIQIKGSYVMVDPAGRFFDNSTGKYKYSKPILKSGVGEALIEMNYDLLKFISRNGLYDWKSK